MIKDLIYSTLSLQRSSISMAVAAEDLEAGVRKPKFQAEPTLPLYLKVTELCHAGLSIVCVCIYICISSFILQQL